MAFCFDHERVDYEARWPPQAQSALSAALLRNPPGIRQALWRYVRERLPSAKAEEVHAAISAVSQVLL
jgi:hypothetical protein